MIHMNLLKKTQVQYIVSMLFTSGLSMIKCTKITFFHFLLRIRSLASQSCSSSPIKTKDPCHLIHAELKIFLNVSKSIKIVELEPSCCKKRQKKSQPIKWSSKGYCPNKTRARYLRITNITTSSQICLYFSKTIWTKFSFMTAIIFVPPRTAEVEFAVKNHKTLSSHHIWQMKRVCNVASKYFVRQ